MSNKIASSLAPMAEQTIGDTILPVQCFENVTPADVHPPLRRFCQML